jgi:drug/metabolite transporter (DMT)-like permease
VKPSWLAILGLVTGFSGITLLVGPSELVSDGLSLDPLGIGTLLMAAFLWAVGSIYSRGADMPPSILMATGAQMLSGSLALLLVSGLTGEWKGFGFATVSLTSWLALLYLITIGALVGFVAYGWLLKNAPVSLVATYAYVNPLVAVFLGAWLADEIIHARILTAGSIIIGSVVLINQTKRKPKGKQSKKEQASAAR